MKKKQHSANQESNAVASPSDSLCETTHLLGDELEFVVTGIGAGGDPAAASHRDTTEINFNNFEDGTDTLPGRSARCRSTWSRKRLATWFLPITHSEAPCVTKKVKSHVK